MCEGWPMVFPLHCTPFFCCALLCHLYGDVLVHKIRDLSLIDIYVDISRKDEYFEENPDKEIKVSFSLL